MTVPLLDAVARPAARIIQYRLAPLARWLDDPLTTDIAINRPGIAWVRRRGKWTSHEMPLTLRELEAIAIRAGSLRDQEVGARDPICDTDLPDGSRWNSVMFPHVPKGSIAVSIRKHTRRSIEADGNISSHYRAENWQRRAHATAADRWAAAVAAWDSRSLDAFLHQIVHIPLNPLLVGSTGAGKTTLAYRMMAHMPMSLRVITIQDTDELKLLHPNYVSLLYSSGGSDASQIGAGALARAAHRMRPDRLIIQELRDDAAVVYIKDTSHKGTFVTVHGRSAADGVRRVFHLVKTSPAGAGMDDMTVLSSIAAVVDVIIPLREHSDEFHIEDVWFAGDPRPGNPSIIDLMREA